MLPPACTGAYAFASQVGAMGAALGVWTAAVLAYALTSPYNSGRLHRWGRLGGRAALTAALVLYPSATAAAASLLHCTPVTVSARALSTLDGGPPLAPSGAPLASVTVPLVASEARTPSSCAGHRGGRTGPLPPSLPLLSSSLLRVCLLSSWRGCSG